MGARLPAMAASRAGFFAGGPSSTLGSRRLSADVSVGVRAVRWPGFLNCTAEASEDAGRMDSAWPLWRDEA